ncbi:SseB family protein [Lipingzhangella sp. LS1_29]|uniref:SseB family protein n=1 Tax=Lipingzhangella rawalii TaxID=2055835 RepID=A0ABU2H3L9_9ACTN|nr:SseB family protein [Lipingzhangella rawalii]MDS1269420.1 SseB family protein [Lipingzhangella rawalii]
MTGPTITGAQRFTDDRGDADPQLRDALQAYTRGQASQRRVLTALGSARLLVPVVTTSEGSSATATDPTQHGDSGHGSSVAVPILVGNDGRRGMLAFTCVDSMRQWRPGARPVPVSVGEACQAACDEGADALVLDMAGPVPYTVEGYFLSVLAEQGTVPEPKSDTRVLAAIYRVTHTEFGIERVRVLDSERADIGVRLELEHRDDDSIRRVADRLAEELRPMLPGGVELSAVVRATRPED